MEKFDLIVIGSGSAGEKAAVKAAYFGYKVAMIEKEKHLSGSKDSLLFQLLSKEGFESFQKKKESVFQSHMKRVEKNLELHEVKLFFGEAVFENANTLAIGDQKICAGYILLATGSSPHHILEDEYDNKKVFDSDTIFQLESLPKSIAIIGANPISYAFATAFAFQGVKVSLFTGGQSFPPLDEEIKTLLQDSMQEMGIDFIEQSLKSAAEQKQIEVFIDAFKRKGASENMGLEVAGVRCDEDGFIEVDENFCTQIPHIYAVGDAIGDPLCASNSMDQGRIAVGKMFQTKDMEHISSVFPNYYYTIPEISFAGASEKELTDQGKSFCVGRCHLGDLDIGNIGGSEHGMLKLIFDPVTLQVLGVHLIGKQASELIHYGILLIENLKTLSYLIGQVFNYPSLHELYKYAAFDGLGNLTGHKIK